MPDIDRTRRIVTKFGGTMDDNGIVTISAENLDKMQLSLIQHTLDRVMVHIEKMPNVVS